MKNCGKNCVSCPYVLKASLYQFLLKNSFNCGSSNLICDVICQECKEEYIGEIGFLVKEQINISRHHIRQQQYQQLPVEEHSFFKILQECKSLRKSYEDYFIEIFKLLLNKKT